MSKIFIGTSGFIYNDWRGIFYPKDLSQNKWLNYYSQYFNSVELNVTFYRLLKRSIFKNWYQRTPKNFIFSLKGNRFITHVKKLKDFEQATKNFFDNIKPLKEKLGIVLWQLPENFHCDIEKLNKFCLFLKQNKLSKNICQAFEFRHQSWFNNEVYKILKKYNFTLCISHSKFWPYKEIATANYLYLRFHGPKDLYASKYSKNDLRVWAKKIKKWLKNKKDVYIYFNNDVEAMAIENALELKKILKLP